MTKLFCLAFSLMVLTTIAQTQEQKDSLVTEICKTISATSRLDDTIRIDYAYHMHLFPFLQKFPEAKAKENMSSIYFRLQRNCGEFKKILERSGKEQQKGDWVVMDYKPNTKLTKEACYNMLKYKKYSYLESTGDTVKLQIENGYWILD
jgi:hypothetical protein